VINLSEEMLVLRDYNRKLRIMLGDNSSPDSLLGDLSEHIASAVPDQAVGNAAVDSDVKEQGNQPATKKRASHTGSGNTADNNRENNSQPADESKAENVVPDASPRTTAAFRAAFPISAPVEGYITRTFQNDKMHFGVDYAGKRGTVISAAADGYVIFSNWTQDDGNIIILSHGGGYVTVYQHNQVLLKQQGDFVKRGTPIALLGDSGTTSSGPHLHFEIWKDGRPQNPSEYLIASEK
jgi:murein DD-endopeptidase MepM/ murein hydrolase activator NlpD